MVAGVENLWELFELQGYFGMHMESFPNNMLDANLFVIDVSLQ